MMFIALVALLTAPFWESKAPEEWSMAEIGELMSRSPWAQSERARLYLASALPMRLAEEQVRKRRKAAELSPTEFDYREFMEADGGKHVVVAVEVFRPEALADAAEVREMESGCWLKSGGRKVRMAMHFPPTKNDPFLRLVFPNIVEASHKSFTVELYAPGAQLGLQAAEFRPAEMVFRGKFER